MPLRGRHDARANSGGWCSARLGMLCVVVASVFFAPWFSPRARGQALLYEEPFPHSGVGDVPIGTVGWANDIPSQFDRLFPQGDPGEGAVYAFQSSAEAPITTAFYTTPSLDTGATGMPFVPISLAAYRGLKFLVDARPTFDPDHVASRFLIQMNGSNWYAHATTLPIPEAREPNFSSYSVAFDPSASGWLTLTLLGTEAAIGGPAPEDLSGEITGAGIVATHSVDSGTHDFDNFRITSDVGVLAVDAVTGNLLTVIWTPSTNVRLQTSGSLVLPAWTDVGNSLGQSTMTVTMNDDAEYLRLSSLPGSTLDPENPIFNPGFDFDGAPVANPQGWTTTGDTAAGYVVVDGATGSAFSLQHAGTSDFQVTTSQLVADLSNGIYRLTAQVKSSGGQKACYLGGNGRRTSLAALDADWTDLVVRGIEVTHNQCLVEIVSNGPSGTWCRVDSLALVRDDTPYFFLKGGDVSELPRLEYYGGQFFDGTVPKDCLEIMKDHGCNIARVRLYNDPGNTNYYPSSELDPLGWQNPSNTLALCERIKNAGMQILLTFHYSDYWTNPGQQYKPHDWEGLSWPGLTNALYTFTRDFMLDLAARDALPDYVSLGNETPNGMLWPEGRNDSSAGWDRFATLLQLGHDAVKSVSPSSKIILHTHDPKSGHINWFFGNLANRTVDFDVIGCSYYPHWTGLTTEQARDEINQWAATYGKPVLIMETGYNWNPTTCDGNPGQLTTTGPETYPETPQGQKDFLLKCFKDLKLVNDGACIGDIYWDPVFICVPGQGWKKGARNVVANTTLFDFDGDVLPSMDAFEFND